MSELGERIFHIATVEDWLSAVETGGYGTSTRGRSLADEGFIHASRADQWAAVRHRFYADCPDALVLLEIDPERLDAPVVDEAVGDETFPHVYGPISPAAVTQARVIAPDEEPRGELPLLAADRGSLDSWLDFMRDTLALKLDGLTPDQLAARSVPPSTLSLIGLVRHLSEVERYWIAEVCCGEQCGTLYCDDDRDGDFNDAAADTALADWARHLRIVAEMRGRQAGISDLDAPLPGLRRGEQVNLRWILTHLIEEYARHLGHADLLREAIDGRTGY